mmetsp:Transcript_32733/g.79551  ORF Transcript_32733/g.79551 Transcript_32733/m.79551 type:complete len:562 (-) Transcript_32733:276-1961(-)
MMFRKTTIAAVATAAASVTTMAFWSVDAVSAKEATTTTATRRTSPLQNNYRAFVGRTDSTTTTTNNDHHRRRLEQVAEDAGAEDANSQSQEENHEYIQATACKAFAVESSSSSEDDNNNNGNGNNENMDTTLMEQIYDWAGLETYRVKEQSYVFYDYDYAYGSSSSNGDENGDNAGNNGAIDFDSNYVIDLQTWMKQMAYSVGGYDYGCRQLEDAYDLLGQDDADLQALASIDVSAYSQETGTNVDDLPSSLDTVYAGSICGMSSTTNGMFGGLFSSNENMILDGIFLDDSCTVFVPRLTYKYRRLLKQGKATSYDIMTAVSILTDYPLDCAQLGTCETLLESSMNSDTCTTFEEDMQSAAEEQEQQEQAQDNDGGDANDEQQQDQNDNNDAGANGGEQDENNGNGGRRLRRMEEQQADDGAETTSSTLPYQISQYDIEQGFDAICSSIRTSMETGTSLETVLSEHGQLQTSNSIDGLSPLGIGLIVGAVCFVLILLIMTVKIRKVKKVKSRRKKNKTNNQTDPDSKEEPLVDSSSSADNDDDRTEKMGDEIEEEVEEMEA